MCHYSYMYTKFGTFFCATRYNKTSIYRHQTSDSAPISARGSRCKVRPPCFGVAPITANGTPSTKPEVHKIALRRQRMSEPRPQGIGA